MPPRKHEAIGQRFGRWIAVSEAPRRGESRLWLCICDCGARKEVWMDSLISKKSTSCGCFQQEQLLKANTRHGMSDSPEFWAWVQMIERCTNDRNESFDHYGGRGISVCEIWRTSFEAFLADMGKRPSGKHSLERNNNDGNYEPDNCRWASRKEQARNTTRSRKVEWRGQTKTIAEWAEEFGVSYDTVRHRVRMGKPFDPAWGTQKGVKFKLLPEKVEAA